MRMGPAATARVLPLKELWPGASIFSKPFKEQEQSECSSELSRQHTKLSRMERGLGVGFMRKLVY